MKMAAGLVLLLKLQREMRCFTTEYRLKNNQMVVSSQVTPGSKSFLSYGNTCNVR